MHRRFFPQEKEGVIKRADGGFSTGYSWAFFVPVDEKTGLLWPFGNPQTVPAGRWAEKVVQQVGVKAARCLSWVMRDGVNRAPPARRFAAQGCSYIGFGQ
jgi:hypothetical protein